MALLFGPPTHFDIGCMLFGFPLGSAIQPWMIQIPLSSRSIVFWEPFLGHLVQDGPHGQPHQIHNSLWFVGLGTQLIGVTLAMAKRVQFLKLRRIIRCKRTISQEIIQLEFVAPPFTAKTIFKLVSLLYLSWCFAKSPSGKDQSTAFGWCLDRLRRTIYILSRCFG